MGHGHEVQHRVCAATQRHVNGKSVMKGVFIYNIPRSDISRQEFHDLLSGVFG